MRFPATFLLTVVFGLFPADPLRPDEAHKPDGPPVTPHTLPPRVFVFFQRTAMHVEHSTASAFHQVVNDVLAYLNSRNVAIAVDEFGGHTFAHHDVPFENVQTIARHAGAPFLLYIVVDRPKANWARITAECYAATGKKLWHEQAASAWAFGSARGLRDTLDELQRQLDQHLGRPGLPLASPLPVH